MQMQSDVSGCPAAGTLTVDLKSLAAFICTLYLRIGLSLLCLVTKHSEMVDSNGSVTIRDQSSHPCI